MISSETQWKDLAIELAKAQGHYLYCPFEGCLCGAVERQIELSSEIFRRMRNEQS